jgi:hypothetical protein
MSALEGVGAAGIMLLLIWWYLSTFELTLTDDAIVYKELWRSTETPIGMVRSIEHGRLSGVSGIWIVHRRDRADITRIKVANFSPSDLRRFAQAVVERDPTIQFTAIPLGRRIKAS